VVYAAHRYAKRHYKNGLCRICPNQAEINPNTGKYYHACPYHLAKFAARQKLYMRKRRANFPAGNRGRSKGLVRKK